MPGLEILNRLRTAASLLRPGQLAVRRFRCPVCGPSFIVRLSGEAIGVRCVRCAASAVTMSLVSALLCVRPGFRSEAVYEMSSRGPLVEFLRREVAQLTCSEYFDDVPPGEWRDAVQCQDVQRLTYPDGAFAVCTSTEVFEHVPDDALGFREVKRVLKRDGLFLFTVPLNPAGATVERAAVRDGVVRHFLPPAYHDDRIRGRGGVLVFRDYGGDITGRLLAQGFSRAWIDQRFSTAFLGHGACVVAAVA